MKVGFRKIKMETVTISLPEKVIQLAKEISFEEGGSLSGYIRKLLMEKLNIHLEDLE